MIISLTLCLVIFDILAVQSQSPDGGAPWTEDEAQIVKNKIIRMFDSGGSVLNEFKKLHPDRASDFKASEIGNGAPQALRLGFHDCLKYKGTFPDDEVNGCDGCLNPEGMGTNVRDKYNITKKSQAGPNMLLSNNNGLMPVADVLEEIYTNPNFPKGRKKLSVSLKESGKSRADLWAFAATLALEFGIGNNNNACDGTYKNGKIGNLKNAEPDCKIEWSRPMKFKTGRKDCTPDPTAKRPYFASREEIHPNVHANGPDTVRFYKTNFGFTAREAIAVTAGAHSFGTFHASLSMFKYGWTRAQNGLLNNQLLRHIAERPQYFIDNKDTKGKHIFGRLVGDSVGAPAKTSWRVWALRTSKDRGPFQWFHIYNRYFVIYRLSPFSHL